MGTSLSTEHGAAGKNSSLQQQNKVQPSLCVIFNNSCRKNVFKAKLFSQRTRGQPLNHSDHQGSAVSFSTCLPLLFLPFSSSSTSFSKPLFSNRKNKTMFFLKSRECESQPLLKCWIFKIFMCI